MTNTIKGGEIKPLANLRGAYLQGANLQGAALYGANLRSANLYGANLQGANLQGADLQGANLRSTNLYGANLRGANLQRANLQGAALYGANLQGANLYDADLQGAKNIPNKVAAALQVLPDEGDVIGWKKCCEGVIVKLLVKSETPRSSATTRKCRAKEVTVLEVFGSDVGVSKHYRKVTYKKDEVVTCNYWEEDRWMECAGGIHFFITKQEAEDY